MADNTRRRINCAVIGQVLCVYTSYICGPQETSSHVCVCVSAAGRTVTVLKATLWARKYSEKSKHTSPHLLTFHMGHPDARQAFCDRGRGRWLQCWSSTLVWFWRTQVISLLLVPRPQVTEHWKKRDRCKRVKLKSHHFIIQVCYSLHHW